MTILVTGAVGFIGFHLAKRLISENYEVIGIDNINDYYDINLKESRLKELYNLKSKSFNFYKVNLENKDLIIDIFQKNKPNVVVNLAAQAGVRYSIEKSLCIFRFKPCWIP